MCDDNNEKSAEKGEVFTFHSPLRSWEPVRGPSKWTIVRVEQSVFLLKAKPCILIAALVAYISARLTMVGLEWRAIVLVRFTNHENVVATTEWIAINRHRMQVDVRVLSERLICR